MLLLLSSPLAVEITLVLLLLLSVLAEKEAVNRPSTNIHKNNPGSDGRASETLRGDGWVHK